MVKTCYVTTLLSASFSAESTESRSDVQSIIIGMFTQDKAVCVISSEKIVQSSHFFLRGLKAFLCCEICFENKNCFLSRCKA
jgi:hypothetical protein